MKLTNQQKGSSLAFIAVLLITPDSLFIRLSHIDTWGMLFHRGAIPFVAVFFGLLMVYRTTFFKLFFVKLGFLEGWDGFIIARLYAEYTFWKYIKEENENINN